MYLGSVELVQSLSNTNQIPLSNLLCKNEYKIESVIKYTYRQSNSSLIVVDMLNIVNMWSLINFNLCSDLFSKTVQKLIKQIKLILLNKY